MNINMDNGSVTIDGKSFSGRNITIKGDKVIVDGVVQEGDLIGNIHVLVQGDVESLTTTSGDIVVNGDVSGGVKTTSGDVDCFNVTGSVTTVSGDVVARDIQGDVKTVSGDIKRGVL